MLAVIKVFMLTSLCDTSLGTRAAWRTGNVERKFGKFYFSWDLISWSMVGAIPTFIVVEETY